MNDRLPRAGTKAAGYVPHVETLIHMDPPRHGRIRNLVSQVFTPRRVAELEPWMRALCREHFRGLPEGEPVDLVAEIAAPVPAITIARLLGVPEERWRHFQHCANAMIEVAAGDPERTAPEPAHTALLGELAADLREWIDTRSTDPRDDLLSALVHVELEGERFDADDVLMMALTLLGAGNETTRTLVSQSCLAFSQYPDQYAQLERDPGLVPGAVEELLRWVTPVHSHTRTAVEDTEIRGRPIAKGAYLVMLYAAANRDEDVWEEPDRLDVTRPPRREPAPLLRPRGALLPGCQPRAARGPRDLRGAPRAVRRLRAGRTRSAAPLEPHQRARVAARPADAPMTPPDLDFKSEANVQDPFPLYGWLRENDPVHWSESLGSWVLTRYADALRVFDEPATFSSERFRALDPRLASDRAPVRAVSRVLADWLVFRDPPDHTRLRRLLQKSFTPRQLEKSRFGIQQTVDDLLDGVAGRGEMDFIRDFAFPLPAVVIGVLLGAPTSDIEAIKRWSDRLAAQIGGSVEAADNFTEAAAGVRELVAYFRELIAERERTPRDDLISLMLRAESEGDKLTSEEVVSNCVLLLFAGHETTTNLLGNGLYHLLRHPDQEARLRASPAPIEAAVEEFLRYDGPVTGTVKVAMRDLEWEGKRIARGERVIPFMSAGNRDPEQFPRPDELDVTRHPNRHLGFGLRHPLLPRRTAGAPRDAARVRDAAAPAPGALRGPGALQAADLPARPGVAAAPLGGARCGVSVRGSGHMFSIIVHTVTWPRQRPQGRKRSASDSRRCRAPSLR